MENETRCRWAEFPNLIALSLIGLLDWPFESTFLLKCTTVVADSRAQVKIVRANGRNETPDRSPSTEVRLESAD